MHDIKNLILVCFFCSWHLWLLEANPGPDLRQAGFRLQWIVDELMEGISSICLDGDKRRNSTSFTLVLDECWTTASVSMTLQ